MHIFIGSIVHNDRIYAFGHSGELETSSFHSEVYDPKTDRWTLFAPMSMSRDRFGVGVVNDEIYAIGGFNRSEDISKR